MILTQPKNALTKQYAAMLESEGVELKFTDDAIQEIAEIAYRVNQEMENIGARRLHTIMSNILNEILFDVPDRVETRLFEIDGDFVRSKLQRISTHKDLNHYIL